MKLFIVIFFAVFLPAQSICAQEIASRELLKLAAEISSLQMAIDGKGYTDPSDNQIYTVSFPKENFNVGYSSGLAYKAEYRAGEKERLYITEQIDLSKAKTVTANIVNNKSALQVVTVSFTGTSIITKVIEKGSVVSTIESNQVQFYYPTGNIAAKNKLVNNLKELIKILTTSATAYHEVIYGSTIEYPDGTYSGSYKGINKRRYGIGTFRFKDGSIYKGGWEDDRMHGKGSLLSFKPVIMSGGDNDPEENTGTYEGEWVNGELEGEGTFTNAFLKYEGHFVAGKMEGKGKMKFRTNQFYEGDWLNNKWNGKGTLITTTGDKYEGEWKDGLKNGFGVFITYYGDKYEGQWKNDRKDGKGIYISEKYGYTKEGQWKDGMMTGYGTLKNVAGDTYEGNWEWDIENGKGAYNKKNGEKYVGEWKSGNRDGYGIYTWPNGEKYEGNWVTNMKQGEGTYIYQNGEKYVGLWYYNKKHGKGILYDKNNKVLKEGRWLNDNYEDPVKPAHLYAKDLLAKYTVINADTNFLVCYNINGDKIDFCFYSHGYNYPAIHFDVNNNNQADSLVDRTYRQFRDKLQAYFILGGQAPSRKVWDYDASLTTMTFPISEISQSTIIAFQVEFKTFEWDKSVYVPSRKEAVNFKKNKMFYITVTQ